MSETELACSTDCGEQEVDSRMQVDLNSNEETCDNDESNQVVETGLNTNYDSSDGAIPMHRYVLTFILNNNYTLPQLKSTDTKIFSF